MKTIKVEEIPAELKARDFLASLGPSQEKVVLEQGGQAWLVVLPAGLLERRQHAKAQLFSLIEELRQRNPEVDSEDVLCELEELDHPKCSAP